MKCIISTHGVVSQFSEKNGTIYETLPPFVYEICESMFGLYLKVTDALTYEGKIYGNVDKRVDRILTTFEDRDNSTGVILSGEKGSGKTLLVKRLAEIAMQKNYPVIICPGDIVSGNGFVDFIRELKMPAVFLMDEFDKMFDDSDKQNVLLNLFDGLYSDVKRLFILTGNYIRNINDLFLNRPGRMFYHFKYKGIEEDMIREYCIDNDVDEDFISDVIIHNTFSYETLSFDSLKAIVEEHKRFGLPFKETCEGLNIGGFDGHSQIFWNVSLFDTKDNKEYPINSRLSIRNFNTIGLYDLGFNDYNYKTIFGKGYTKIVDELDEIKVKRAVTMADVVSREQDRIAYNACDESKRYQFVFTRYYPKYNGMEGVEEFMG